MKERDKYIIVVENQLIEVTKEVYGVYYKAERRERYFMHDLKAGRSRIDKETGEKVLLPSLEDSYERLSEINEQFIDRAVDVEEEAIQKLLIEKLHKALHMLLPEEAELIWYLYYEQISEVELAKEYGIA